MEMTWKLKLSYREAKYINGEFKETPCYRCSASFEGIQGFTYCSKHLNKKRKPTRVKFCSTCNEAE